MARWMNIEEAAEYLGLGRSLIYSLAQEGRIPANKIGKFWRLDQEKLDSWVRAKSSHEEFFLQTDAVIEDNLSLRDPQREGYLAAREYFTEGGSHALLQIPVGCGKSGLIAILPFGIARGRVLVIAPNVTIRDTLARSLDISNPTRNFWKRCGILSREATAAGPYLAVLDGPDANVHDCDNSHIVLTNIQQLASSADRWLPQFADRYFDLILVDEGHHNVAASWKKVFDKFPDAKVASLTATPFRSDKQELTGDIIYRYTFRRAMLKGYIKPLQARYVAPDELTFTYQGETKKHTLEDVLRLKEEDWFSKGVALSKECNGHIVDASLDRLEIARKSGTPHQLIAVACSIRHAKQIRSLYAERGYEAEVIDSEMDKPARTEVLQKLRSGTLDCIIQVQILGEGFDHPNLSVAAVFRPFRSLGPYIQFIGRVMRVIVQGDPYHPDNLGSVVSHIGMNTDSLLNELRKLDRDDRMFFEAIMKESEPALPPEVLRGEARQRFGSDMVVNHEIVTNFFEEGFLDAGNEALFEDLRKQAELLGLDPDEVLAAIPARVEGMKTRPASPPIEGTPQRRRQEAKKRLNEEVHQAARLLLNRMGMKSGGRELIPITGGVGGNNFAVAVKMVSSKLNEVMSWEAGKRGEMKLEELEQGIAALDSVLNEITRQLKATLQGGNDDR